MIWTIILVYDALMAKMEGIMAKEIKEKKTNAPKIGFFNSIKSLLIMLLVTIAVVPLVISTAVSYFTSTNKAMKDAQESLEWQAVYIRASFESIM